MAEKSFTESLDKLQRAATDISRQATTLEESLKLFEEGMKEAEFCKKYLESASQQITVYEEEQNA